MSEATRARLATALPGADRLGNPIDLGVRATSEDERVAVEALLDDDAVDAVLVVHVGLGGADPDERLAALEDAVETRAANAALVRRRRRRPSPSWPASSAATGGCPSASSGACRTTASRRPRSGRWRSPPTGATGSGAASARRRRWTASTRPPRRRSSTRPARAGSTATRTVALLRAAGLELADAPGGDAEAAAVAVLVGAVNDAEFGPVVGVAPGGGLGWAGPIPGDAAFRLAPLTDVDAEELVDGPPAVRAALATGSLRPRRAARRRSSASARSPTRSRSSPRPSSTPSWSPRAGVTLSGARVRLAPPPARERAKTW